MAWTEALQISNSVNPYIESNYRSADASWFQRSWWSTNSCGWKYTNDTAQPVKLKSATFLACAGNSNGKVYSGDRGGVSKYVADGSGCTFTSIIYVVDKSGNKVGEPVESGTVVVPPANQYNCAYGDVRGATSTSDDQTSFGSLSYYGPGFPGFDQEGRYRAARTITYTTSPSIPVGGKMFVLIKPTKWTTTGNSSLLVIQNNAADFEADVEPVQEDYIWIYLKKPGGPPEGKWYKERKAFIYTNTGWKEMEA